MTTQTQTSDHEFTAIIEKGESLLHSFYSRESTCVFSEKEIKEYRKELEDFNAMGYNYLNSLSPEDADASFLHVWIEQEAYWGTRKYYISPHDAFIHIEDELDEAEYDLYAYSPPSPRSPKYHK